MFVSNVESHFSLGLGEVGFRRPQMERPSIQFLVSSDSGEAGQQRWRVNLRGVFFIDVLVLLYAQEVWFPRTRKEALHCTRNLSHNTGPLWLVMSFGKNSAQAF
jgi:hypothetical protein